MEKPSPDAATMPDVLIHLEQGDSVEPLSAGSLIQRHSYSHLKNQIDAHIRNLGPGKFNSESRYPAGSGWTQFLDGTRGAGKSTFLNSVRSILKEDASAESQLAFIALIDPSRIERSEIILLVILQHLRNAVKTALETAGRVADEELGDRWHKTLRSVAGGLSLFSKDYHPLDGVDPELFLDWGLDRAHDSTSLRKNLHELFDTACSILGVRALMFAFDDADTNASQAISLLECIRKYLDAPIVMVLVTGDLELYSLLVRQHFAETVVGKRESALELQRRSTQTDRSAQYLRMIDHLEEQYLLKLFPIRRRMQLRPLWNVMQNANCRVTRPDWGNHSEFVADVVQAIVKRGLRVKTKSDVSVYVEFLLKQPLRSVLQVMTSCIQHLEVSSTSGIESVKWSPNLTADLSRSLQALALTSLYKYSIDTDAIAAHELPALTQAVFDLSLLDGDIDTAPYLRPLSAEPDIRACFAALAAEVPNFCAGKPSIALRYMLRGPGSVSLYSLARSYPAEKDPSANLDRIAQFKSYMGIGRREDSLDWARRATAMIAVPYGINPKVRVVLPGVVGLKRKRTVRSREHTARTAIRLAIESDGIGRLPVLALSMVDVASAAGVRTYGSIFTIVGLIEKILSVERDDDHETRKIFERAYPSLTVSGPSWISQGDAEEREDAESPEPAKRSLESSKQEKLLHDVNVWRRQALSLTKASLPSAIFLGKVWTRLFFSLQKAAEELRPRSNLATVMEIFALCVINAFLVEEAEHHFSNSPDTSNSILKIDKNNPRSSASWFVDKLAAMKPRRRIFPLTSSLATCPLLLGLLDSRQGYAAALKLMFPTDTTVASIQALLCPQELTGIMEKISVAGQSGAKVKAAVPRAIAKSSKSSRK